MSDCDPSPLAAKSAPVIGLTTYREQAQTGVWDAEFALLHATYVTCVARAGGAAMLLPPQHDDAAALAVARLDGIVLTGGADVSPHRYQGRAQDPATFRLDRDAWEMALLEAAMARDIPVLGVCRGLQLINVALGGSLEQHVPDRVQNTSHQPAPGQFGDVDVDVEPDSLLFRLVGDRTSVRCYHHQALMRLAPNLRRVARAADNTVEAAEDPDRDFLLGIQWHPEQDGTDLRLFAGLVEAARRRTAAATQDIPVAPTEPMPVPTPVTTP